MTEPSRRFSSEAASNTKSPVGSVRQGTTPPRSPYHPDRRRLSSNSQDRPASALDQASVNTHQRQQRSGGLQPPSQESLLLQQHQAQQQQPTPPAPPVFTPVFALVDDATGRPTTHHPRVHYIFSDDDPEELTAALDDAAADHPHPPTSSGGMAATPGLSRDRAIVVDLVPAPDGRLGSFSVASAVSLSPEWAVTSAQVSRIQTGGSDADVPGGGVGGKGKARDNAEAGDDKDDGGSGSGDSGLMLRIEGVGVDPAAAAAAADNTLTLSGSSSGGSRHSERRRQKPQQGPGPNGEEEFAALADDFDRRMGTLRRVVDASIPGLPSEEQRSSHAAAGDEAVPLGSAAADAGSSDHKAAP